MLTVKPPQMISKHIFKVRFRVEMLFSLVTVMALPKYTNIIKKVNLFKKIIRKFKSKALFPHK